MIQRVSLPSFSLTGRLITRQHPARADTFEAFIGAVAEVHGVEVLTKWIEDLMGPCRHISRFVVFLLIS